MQSNNFYFYFIAVSIMQICYALYANYVTTVISIYNFNRKNTGNGYMLTC